MPYVFISYRRADSQTIAGRINDRLIDAFDADHIFKDVDDIRPGSDFRSAIQKAISACDVVLVIIGPHWLHITDQYGRRRLDDPFDFVRLEVQTALERPQTRVIPVLVYQAQIPSANVLPPRLNNLAYRNAVFVRDDPDFHRDMDRLIRALRDDHKDFIENIPAQRNSRRRRLILSLLFLLVAVAFILGILARLPSDSSLPLPTALVVQPTAVTPAATKPQTHMVSSVHGTPSPTTLSTGRQIHLLWNEASFYAWNPTDTDISVRPLRFEALRANGDRLPYGFNGTPWSYFYPRLEPGKCNGLEIGGTTEALQPTLCRSYNAIMMPEPGDSTLFWLTRPEVTQFRVLWNNEEIALCPIVTGACIVNLPSS